MFRWRFFEFVLVFVCLELPGILDFFFSMNLGIRKRIILD